MEKENQWATGDGGLTYVSATIGIVIAVACAWYCRRLALEKRRNVPLWTVLGFVLTVVAVPVLFLLPAANRGVGGASSGGVEDSPTRVAMAR